LKKFPSQEKAAGGVIGLPDGRIYETDKDISIRPMPINFPAGKAMPMPMTQVAQIGREQAP
jgi:hypothetical protein